MADDSGATMAGIHPAWLPAEAWRAVGSRRVVVLGADTGVGAGGVAGTVLDEVEQAVARFGGSVSSAGGSYDLLLCLSTVDEVTWGTGTSCTAGRP
jgi:alpha-glucuronidase